MERPKALEAAKFIKETRYKDASLILLAGSVVRGDETAYSDLDVVVIYENLKHARRESFIENGWPVEAFIHDLETLRYFFYKVDAPSGIPALPQMVLEGIPIPEKTTIENEVKSMAKRLLTDGPGILSTENLDRMRYSITDLVDDLRETKNNEELVATGSRLYEILADFYFRSNNKWSANRKMIPRNLLLIDKSLAKKFADSFDNLFQKGNPKDVISLSEELLKPYGGFLFDGFNMDAPNNWRLKDDKRDLTFKSRP